MNITCVLTSTPFQDIDRVDVSAFRKAQFKENIAALTKSLADAARQAEKAEAKKVR